MNPNDDHAFSLLIEFFRCTGSRQFGAIPYMPNLSERKFAARQNSGVMEVIRGHLLEEYLDLGSSFEGILTYFGLSQADAIYLFGGPKNDMSGAAIAARLERFERERRCLSECDGSIPSGRFFWLGDAAEDKQPFFQMA